MKNNILDIEFDKAPGFQRILNILDLKTLFLSKLHRQNIKKAKRLYKFINKREMRENPARIFGCLRKADPFVFEELLLIAFKNKGVRAIRNHAYTGDGGIDGRIVLQDKRVIAIQAKRYQSHINPKHILDLKRTIKYKYDGGLFIHTGKTGGKSYENLSSNIKLISGERLIALLTI